MSNRLYLLIPFFCFFLQSCSNVKTDNEIFTEVKGASYGLTWNSVKHTTPFIRFSFSKNDDIFYSLKGIQIGTMPEKIIISPQILNEDDIRLVFMTPEPNFVNWHEGKEKSILIFSGGDGAGAFTVKLTIQNNKLVEKSISGRDIPN